MAKNVLGTPLESCCNDPVTGFYRDGYCRTHNKDFGKHWLCAVVTQEFLEYSHTKGNDLITPRPDHNFPGLKPGDGWCLCTARWLEAHKAGCAPPLKLRACHENALSMIDLDTLNQNAVADAY